MATVPLQGELTELFSGVLHKVGGKVKTWNRRYFILKSDYCLYYYKDTSKGALGTISLRDPKFKARKGEAGDISWPKQTKLECTMAIVTSHRTYCVYCTYSHEIEEWIRMLTKAREKMLAQSKRENKLLSGSRSSSSSQVEQTSTRSKVEGKTRPVSTSKIPEQDNYEAVYDQPDDKNKDAGKNQPLPNNTIPEGLYSLASSTEEQILYEDILPAPAEEQVLYEDLHPEDQVYDDVHPLQSASESPPPTLEGGLKEGATQPLYDDIADDSAKEPQQPLYEDMTEVGYKQGHDSSDQEEEDRQESGPSLPPRNTATAPSLPPRNAAPSLPPRSEVSLQDNADDADEDPPTAITPTRCESPQPLTHGPATPTKGQEGATGEQLQQPLYDDVANDPAKEPQQPLYEDMADDLATTPPTGTSVTHPSTDNPATPPSDTPATPPSDTPPIPSDTPATPPSPSSDTHHSDTPATHPSDTPATHPSDTSTTPPSDSPRSDDPGTPPARIPPSHEEQAQKPTPAPRQRRSPSQTLSTETETSQPHHGKLIITICTTPGISPVV